MTREHEVAEFEADLGVALPEDYRDFLCEEIEVDKSARFFSIPSSVESDSRVHVFYSFDLRGEESGLSECYETFLGRMPMDLLPIASDPFGDQICLRIKGDCPGGIWLWFHDRPGNEKIQGCIKLAASFEEFLAGLHEVKFEPTDVAETLIETSDLAGIDSLLKSGFDVESRDSNGRTLIERAAIHNKLEVIEYLLSFGVDPRNSLALAEKNFEYFPEYECVVQMLRKI